MGDEVVALLEIAEERYVLTTLGLRAGELTSRRLWLVSRADMELIM
jgi:hypothetical protein